MKKLILILSFIVTLFLSGCMWGTEKKETSSLITSKTISLSEIHIEACKAADESNDVLNIS